jgi:[ribosomal protein S18]-alanine N-acetyltransferase
VKIERLGPGDVERALALEELLDGPPRVPATTRFLQEAGHHLLVAYEADVPVGMVTGVEMTHPDKGTEMFLYELSVAEAYRRLGIGRALVDRLADIARSVGCYGMWVLTDHDNDAAIATYRSADASPEGDHVMLGWTFEPVSRPAT